MSLSKIGLEKKRDLLRLKQFKEKKRRGSEVIEAVEKQFKFFKPCHVCREEKINMEINLEYFKQKYKQIADFLKC